MDSPPAVGLTQALALLPHGPEFRFIHRLTQLTPGKSGSGSYQVPAEEGFLRGHFPGNPLMPGVLLIEGAAQLAGVVAQSDPVVGAMPGLKLTAIRGVKIFGSALPGETILFRAEITGRMGNLLQARITAYVGHSLILQGELTLSGQSPL